MTSPASAANARQLRVAASAALMTQAAQRATRPLNELSQTVPQVITTPLKLDPSAFLSPKATVIGSHTITVLKRAIVHPFATLDSTLGPIEIGEGSIVWEFATLGVSRPPEVEKMRLNPDEDQASGASVNEIVTTTIGRDVAVEAHAVIEAHATLGNNCLVEAGSRVGSRAIVGEVRAIFIRHHSYGTRQLTWIYSIHV